MVSVGFSFLLAGVVNHKPSVATLKVLHFGEKGTWPSDYSRIGVAPIDDPSPMSGKKKYFHNVSLLPCLL